MGASLDERIGADHGIRLLDDLLEGLDWNEWECAYKDEASGRPPVHPRLMCGAILYGLIKRVGSLRGLEEATRMRLDFQWLLEGRVIDHTTFGRFKSRFDGKIQELFGQINREAGRLRKASIEELVIDGTRLRADSDRHGARTAEALQKRLTGLEERLCEQLAALDQIEGAQASGREELEVQLERLEARREKLERALEEANRRDALKRAKDGAKAVAVRVPVTDPDAHLMPNKEGGHAPNYTAVVAVESRGGLIVAAEVAEGGAEADSVDRLIEEASETLQGKPDRVLFDGGFASGRNLESLNDKGIEVYAGCCDDISNPALREDGTEPVDPSRWEQLPKRGGKLDRAAFLYDQDKDLYHCPVGRVLRPRRQITRKDAAGSSIQVIEYRCDDCRDCPLAAQCRRAKARTLCRDIYQPSRDELRQRMQSEAARTIYARRAPVVEGVFGTIKSAMGLRRFPRRGRVKVRADWFWICAAFNLRKLIKPVPAGSTGSKGPKSGLSELPNPHIEAAMVQPLAAWLLKSFPSLPLHRLAA